MNLVWDLVRFCTAKINSRPSAILLSAILIVCCLFRGVCVCVPVFIGHSRWLKHCHCELLLCVSMSGWEEKQCTVWPIRDSYRPVCVEKNVRFVPPSEITVIHLVFQSSSLMHKEIRSVEWTMKHCERASFKLLRRFFRSAYRNYFPLAVWTKRLHHSSNALQYVSQ